MTTSPNCFVWYCISFLLNDTNNSIKCSLFCQCKSMLTFSLEDNSGLVWYVETN